MSVEGLILIILVILVVLVSIIFYALFDTIVLNLRRKLNLIPNQQYGEGGPYPQDQGAYTSGPSPEGYSDPGIPPPGQQPGWSNSSWSDQPSQSENWGQAPSGWQTPPNQSMPQMGSQFRPPGNPFAPPPGQAKEWRVDDAEQDFPEPNGHHHFDAPSQPQSSFHQSEPAFHSAPQPPAPPQFSPGPPQPPQASQSPASSPHNSAQSPNDPSPAPAQPQFGSREPYGPAGPHSQRFDSSEPQNQPPGQPQQYGQSTPPTPSQVPPSGSSQSEPSSQPTSTPYSSGSPTDGSPSASGAGEHDGMIRMPDAEKVPQGDNNRFVLSGQQAVKFDDPLPAVPEFIPPQDQPASGGSSGSIEVPGIKPADEPDRSETKESHGDGSQGQNETSEVN
jgi:hypothetical protein